MDLNDVEHDKMRAILEKITWIIEVDDGENVEVRQAGFAIANDLIMSTANSFRNLKKNKNIRGRVLQNNRKSDLRQVFMMEKWDVIIFQLPSDVRCNQVGNFVRDGRLNEKQIVLHMGHHIMGAYHVGRVQSPCVQDVKLPSDDNLICVNYNPSEQRPYPIIGDAWNNECYPDYPIMGHAWNAEVYKKYRETNESFELAFAWDFHPHVPIIELNGFSNCYGDLGGPIINTSGEIVGMFARS